MRRSFPLKKIGIVSDMQSGHWDYTIPEVRRGSFTYRPEVHRWVWTTFNSFQWDLNYVNPAVFNRMAEELLFLANQGVEIHSGFDHRQFLNAFYTGRFTGSFARGLPFQENPKTGDCRISGTCASLAGLERALREGVEAETELSIRLILLIHSMILSIGGIPLLYLGDELGTLNDYAYRNDPAKAADSRWVHRPYTDWARVARRDDPASMEGRVFTALRRMIALRKGCAAFAGDATAVFDTGNGHVFGFVHRHGAEQVLVLANFSESEQTVAANILRTHGLGYVFDDLITGDAISCARDLVVGPYCFVWLVANA